MAHQQHRPTVLHVRVVADQGGGPDKTILRSMRYLRQAGYRAAAAYIHPPGHDGINTILERAKREKAPVFAIADRGAFDATSAFRLARLCRDLNVTIWHAHDYKSEALGLMIRGLRHIKLISTLHGYVHADRKAQFLYEIGRQCLRAYDRVIAVSPDLLESARKASVSPDRLSHIPNAIELNDFSRTLTTTEAKQILNLNPERYALGVVARLSGEKRVDRAIETFHHLLQLGIDAELHILGDGPQRDQLEQQAQARNALSRIHFHGWTADIRNHIQALDLQLLTSTVEGLPNALLEAMALEVPVAATPVGGVRNLLEQGKAGILLDDQPENWAPRIAALLTDGNARNNLIRNARARIETHYSFLNRMQRVIEIYDQLVMPNATPNAA
ncbi:glycosyltransferase [Mucisphaera calidilacus]|uniref:Alpha-D-kanosaminyltransferase n=1 Tax=Mucisphaera calidilacus TaxID=2527982 RepID=A0A518BXH5_9BACT|nr:glycosyltransferase [Mucisphaera calidilacus]QDU71682.1 Alpha-D-kanosaminyltransferase [Mucisphaera calidilacus]